MAVLDGSLLEKGSHIINIGGSGVPDKKTMDRVDVYLRFGDAPSPVGMGDLVLDDEFIGWEARPGLAKIWRRPRAATSAPTESRCRKSA